MESGDFRVCKHSRNKKTRPFPAEFIRFRADQATLSGNRLPRSLPWFQTLSSGGEFL